MTRLAALVAALGVLVTLGLGPADAAKRSALVIGINKYDDVSDLEKAVGDAKAMATKLRALGFDVTELLDADRRTLNQTISTFAASLSEGDTAFVHFSGHGIDIDGDNYLLPADVPKPSSGQKELIKDEAFAMSRLVRRIANSGARTRVFVIDACRENPFEQAGLRSIGNTHGLARIEATAGTFIMLSAGYGQLALDRLGEDDPEPTSIYTRTLLNHIGQPGKSIVDIAQDVRGEVQRLARSVGHDQRPAYYDELTARLVLVEPDQVDEQQTVAADLRPTLGEAAQAWAATKDTTSVAVLKAFIARFEDTLYGDLASARLEEMTAVQQQSDSDGNNIATVIPDEGEQGSDDQEAEAQQFGWLGVEFRSVTDQIASDLGLDEPSGAIVVEPSPGGPAEAAGIATGDVILEIDGKSVEDSRSLASIVAGNAAGTSVNLSIWRDGASLEVPVALTSVQQSAKSGVASAMQILGRKYQYGQGFAKNGREAINWYRKAADAGLPAALHDLGFMYANGDGIAKDEREAARLFRQAADEGVVHSMRSLGAMYESGLGIPEDKREAVYWYRKSAEAGDPAGLKSLGFMYANGLGVTKDDHEAVRWFKEAADKGNIAAISNLGAMYDSGRGVGKDEVEAARLYRKAADAGLAQAMHNLAVLYRDGRGVDKDEREAVSWFRKATEADDPSAMYNLGVMYRDGRGVGKDEREAANLFQEAADAGDAFGMAALGVAYEFGQGVETDHQFAAEQMFRALKAGDEFTREQMTKNSTTWSSAFRRELQRLLRSEGFYDGAIDGQFGPGTRAAIEALASR